MKTTVSYVVSVALSNYRATKNNGVWLAIEKRAREYANEMKIGSVRGETIAHTRWAVLNGVLLVAYKHEKMVPLCMLKDLIITTKNGGVRLIYS